MSGGLVAHVVCPHCGRTGRVVDPKAVRELMRGWRPRRFRCDPPGCGRNSPTEGAALWFGYDGGVNPRTGATIGELDE